MRKKTLRVLSGLMCVFFLVSLFQAPLMAAVETIPVRVGNQTVNVTPGQWVSVRSGTQITHYNVRFVDGKPVALEMSQYTKLIFGDASVAGTAGSTADDVAQATSGKTSGSTSGKTSTGSSSGSSSSASGQPVGGGSNQSSSSQSSSQVSGSVADDVAQAPSTSGKTSSSGKTTTGSTSQSSGSSSQSSSAGSVADDVANAGSVADDVAASGKTTTSTQPRDPKTGRFVAKDSTQSSSTSAGSVADDVANTSGSTGNAKVSSSQSTQGNSVSAGSVADDVANAGSVADDVAASGKSTTTTTTSETTTTKTTWDPSKHPRDPQTGRFISQEEAVSRGLMDPPETSGSSSQGSQSSQSSQNSQTAAGSTADDVAAAGSTADDVAAAGSTADDVAAAGSTADDVAQAGAVSAGSTADDAAAATSGKTKPSIGDKFKAGYATGKGMTNQGVQNVKDSLKSGFSAKNLLITAGITVGVDLATQIMRGEKPSVKKALKTVCSAEFVGGVGGAVLGAAAGSFFVPFLSAVPVVGGVLSALAPSFGSIVGSSVGAYVAGDLKNGKFSIKEAFKRIDWVGVTGQAIGSTAGAALGSFLGPVGTIVGGMVGGYLGNWAAQKIAGMFRKDGSANMPEIAMPTGAPVGGSVITIGGDDATTSTPAPATSNEPITISGEVVGDYESEVALAYSKYQELYKLYVEMVNQGRQDDANKVAAEMNNAKREYDDLRSKSSK